MTCLTVVQEYPGQMCSTWRNNYILYTPGTCIKLDINVGSWPTFLFSEADIPTPPTLEAHPSRPGPDCLCAVDGHARQSGRYGLSRRCISAVRTSLGSGCSDWTHTVVLNVLQLRCVRQLSRNPYTTCYTWSNLRGSCNLGRFVRLRLAILSFWQTTPARMPVQLREISVSFQDSHLYLRIYYNCAGEAGVAVSLAGVMSLAHECVT